MFPTTDQRRRLATAAVLSAFLLTVSACGAHMPPAKPIGIFLHPNIASAYSNSSQDSVVFTILGNV